MSYEHCLNMFYSTFKRDKLVQCNIIENVFQCLNPATENQMVLSAHTKLIIHKHYHIFITRFSLDYAYYFNRNMKLTFLFIKNSLSVHPFGDFCALQRAPHLPSFGISPLHIFSSTM